jgi:hypothetical protein
VLDLGAQADRDQLGFRLPQGPGRAEEQIPDKVAFTGPDTGLLQPSENRSVDLGVARRAVPV